MNTASISKFVLMPVVLCMVSAAPMMARAQGDGTNGPPKVLVIHREFTKPGKEGAAHEKTEGAFVDAVKANHGQLHYLAMTSLSGVDRALFFSGYPTFAAWEEEELNVSKNPALASAMDSSNQADGDLLSATDKSVWVRRDDLSLNDTGIAHARYLQISQYVIRPGHSTEWEDAVKLLTAAYKKGVPEAHWTMFASRYGNLGNAYLVVTTVKSGSQMDQMLGSGKAFREAMGEEGMQKLQALESSAIQSQQTNLFAISPKMSNPLDTWVKADPDFWNPKQ